MGKVQRIRAELETRIGNLQETEIYARLSSAKGEARIPNKAESAPWPAVLSGGHFAAEQADKRYGNYPFEYLDAQQHAPKAQIQKGECVDNYQSDIYPYSQSNIFYLAKRCVKY
jgi:hypothetical protein